MKTKHIIIGLVIILGVLFFVQKKEHEGSAPPTPPNLSNEAIQNIARVYADTNNEAVFNNLKTTGNATINGATTLKGATTLDGAVTFNNDITYKGHPLVECNWEGIRNIYGTIGGREDDMHITCKNYKVTKIAFDA